MAGESRVGLSWALLSFEYRKNVNFCLIATRSANLQDLTKGIKMIAALYDDDNDGNKLLDAARNLADAFSNLLKSAQLENKDVRMTFLTAKLS